MFKRRSVMAGGLALGAAPLTMRAARAEVGRPALVFIGHNLGGGCIVWRAQYQPVLRKSAAFKKIDYYVVHPVNGSLILKEESWPAAARWILADFQMSDEGAQHGGATPRFILTQDKKIILTATGGDGWKNKIWPKLLEVTGTQA